jgi:hypothetical protein
MLYRPIPKIQEDIKWKQELSSFQKIFIGTVCHPAMQRLTYLGISWIRNIKKACINIEIIKNRL